MLSLNTARAPFDKPEVRHAIALAIDRAALAGSIWHGFGRPAAGPFPAAFLAGGDRSAPIRSGAAASPDPIERANALLDAAGHPRREDGIRFTLIHDVTPLGPDWQRLSEGIELQLARAGIKVSSRFETIEAWLQRLSTGDDFALASHITYGLSDPAIGLHRTLHGAASQSPSPFSNSARWRNAEADALLDRALVELEPRQRLQLYRQVQDLALDAAPMVWLAELIPPVLVHPSVQRLMTAPLGLYGNFAEATIAGPRQSSLAEGRTTTAQATARSGGESKP